jgi:Flp pilus assembly pilin Flp
MEFTNRIYLRAREALVRSHRGQTYTEYALVFVFVIIVLITGYQKLGNTLYDAVQGVAGSVSSA